MTDTPPRKPTFRTLALVAIAAAAAGFLLCYSMKEQIDMWLENGDTPIIVRDGSIVITSVGEKLADFSKFHANVLIHPKTNRKIGRMKVDDQMRGTPCQGTKECGVEFVWYTGTLNQADYREYTVVVGSNSVDGKTAGIVSSIPFSAYDHDLGGTQNPQTGKWEYSYRWSPAGEALTFRHARLQTTPQDPRQAKPAPQVICSKPGCKVEFEYK